VNQGICGKAVREGRTIVVDDVQSSPEYLACFLETWSEIVVPIRGGSGLLGEIDVDGNVLKAFDASDGRFLESVAARIAPALEAAVAPSSSGAAAGGSPAAPPGGPR
jgi:L-methionine (R)-S-oxide reductase